jgi:ABC-2 type transport system permease protein
MAQSDRSVAVAGAVEPTAAQEGAGVVTELRALGFLLRPRWLGARNRALRLSRPERVQMAFLGLLALAFGAAVFLLFRRALNYFLAVPDLGPVLTYKMLGMVFMAFFSILLFSNIVTSLSTFFLSRDLDRLASAPIPPARFFYSRFLETLFDSSWMVILFAVPAFLAYGVVHRTGPLFYLAVVATLPPFLVIPCAIGITLTALLVNIFPARRTKDILLLLSIVAVAVLYLFFRMLQPERLVKPEAFADFMEFLGAMQAPTSSFLPSTWAAETLFPLLGMRGGSPGFYYLLLTSTAAVSAMGSELVLRYLFLPGWTKAQEGRQARLTRQAIWERLLRWLTAPFSEQTQLIVIKDVKTFFRDTSQWSQLILLLALVVVYVYNFSVLPLTGSPLVTFYFKNVIAFLNLALAGFVVSAVSVRFIFPSISLEGRAFWVLRTAPLGLRRLWWAKFWVGLAPLLVLGEVLVLATNSYLRVMPFMTWLSSLTLFGMTFGVVSLGLAVGAAFPNFDADNAARVAAGAGGLLYMILCMSFIGLVVVLEAWPVYVLFYSWLRQTPISVGGWMGVIASIASVLVVNVAVFVAATRYGLRRLEAIEI